MTMWSKKGTWTWADTLYWFFYIPLTAFVVMALVIIPRGILNNAVQPFTLDAGIMQERLVQKITAFSPILGVQGKQLSDQFPKSATLSLSEKRYAYKVASATQEYVGNKEFYEIAVPLAPIRFNRYSVNKPMFVNGVQTNIFIDQVFPKKYEKNR